MTKIWENCKWAEKTFWITWDFQTPLSPHHGGLHKAAVKSVKRHLERVVGTTNLTLEEFTTLITQIEACVNSRPICALSEDPADLNALTPGHLLTGDHLMTLVEPKPLLDHEPAYLTRFERIQQMYQDLWNRWSNEYIKGMITRTRWTKERPNIKVNDLVVIKEDNLVPSEWCTGRITQVFPTKDGLVRTVQVRTKTGYYLRPITKLAILPLHDAPPERVNNNSNHEDEPSANEAQMITRSRARTMAQQSNTTA